MERDRRTAAKSLNAFTRRMLGLEPARHHLFVNEKLEAVERGEIKRLMLFEPPGHAKSTYASHLFPAWYLGRNPRKSVIAASHTAQLATKFGRRVRNLFDLNEWPFPDVALAADSKAADQWETVQGGEYFAAGVGGGIAGRRADLADIDDPIKGRKDADSITVRENLWEWYRADLHNRLKPNAAIILTQTRWHMDDLAGRILPEDFDGRTGWVLGRDGEWWFVVNLPALAEAEDALGRAEGEALWPGWYSREHLLAEKTVQGPRNWAALYQQRPAPEEGAYFKLDWLRWYDDVDEPPKHLHKYGASDYAVTADGGDFTVHGVAGVDPEDNIYVLDWWREQTESAEWVEALLDLMQKHKPLAWAEPREQIPKAMNPIIRKRMRERKVYCIRREYSEAGDKPTKARAIQARMEGGKVYLPRNAPWLDDLVSELLHFPAGVFDDQVDCLSLFGRMLDRLVPGRVPSEPKPINLEQPTLDELLALQPKHDSEGLDRI
jgi:predicted phage terminase large subunit-like protein